jgi:hypothetical protein
MHDIYRWEVPSVCTGVWADIPYNQTLNQMVEFIKKRFGHYLDYALWWHTVTGDEDNVEDLHEFFGKILKMKKVEFGGVTIYSATPCQVYEAFDKFMSSEASIEHGYANYFKLNDQDYDESKLTLATSNEFYPTYILGSDSHFGTNRLGLYEGFFEYLDEFDEEEW